MKLIAQIEDSKVDFVFIADHWDIHLNGTCRYNGRLCEFKGSLPDWDEKKEEWKEVVYDIYQLSWRQRIKWYWTQWLFEKCVGYHWTYPHRINGINFHYRKPQWLYKLLFRLYYKI